MTSVRLKNQMRVPAMKILYGPPGTGKTWRAAREAVKAVDPVGYQAALASREPDAALSKLHSGLISDGRILWVTFHPSYSYEDFVEGYRPTVDDQGQLAYRVVDGPFKSLCLRSRFERDLQIGERLSDASGRPAGIVVDKDSGGWIVRVTPNRSDEVAASIDKYVPRYVVDRILERGFPPQIFSIPGQSLLELTDYGIEPTDDDVPPPRDAETATKRQGSVIRKIIAARTGMFSSSDISNASHIGSVVRRMLELADEAPAESSQVAIVIDEINRADPSRVFGELLTLLESSKRQGMIDETRILLPYSKTLFSVPSGVSVIGTMNTVDKSLTNLDFAMRRRFEFELIAPDTELVSDNHGGIDVRSFLKRVNGRLSLLLGTGKEFGHSYLMTRTLVSVSDKNGWLADADGDARAIAHVIRANLLPTLSEYFHGDWGRIRATIAEAKTVDGRTLSLLDSIDADDKFLARLPDDYGDQRLQTYTAADWWDPRSVVWDANAFREFVNAVAAGN